MSCLGTSFGSRGFLFASPSSTQISLTSRQMLAADQSCCWLNTRPDSNESTWETWGHERRRPTGTVSAGTERSALCFPPPFPSLSSCYTLCHAVRMTEIPQGSLFWFRQASFSTTKRLHQTKWLLSERIWTSLKSPPRSRPRVSHVYLAYLLCFYFKPKRVYQSVVCGYSLAVTFDCFDFRKKIRRGPCFRVRGWE